MTAFGVAWAGEERSPAWFDVARELTERWHHQAHIRLATGALTGERARAEARVEGDERLAAPFFGTLAVMA